MKKATEILPLGKGDQLLIEKRMTAKNLTVTLISQNESSCLLHWAVSANSTSAWESPPKSNWPPKTNPAGSQAVQTPFNQTKKGNKVTLKFASTRDFSSLVFVLFYPQRDSWDNNHGKNYRIKLPQANEPLLSPIQSLSHEIENKEIVFKHNYSIAGKELAVAVTKTAAHYQIHMLSDLPGPLHLHWGICKRSRQEWFLPPESLWPEKTKPIDQKAVQSCFKAKNGLSRLQMEWQEENACAGLVFVLFQPKTNTWLKAGHDNTFIPVKISSQQQKAFDNAELAATADDIIQAEMSHNSWTLMHRFNLCYSMTERHGSNLQALALLFVWLRFSAIRQLDWQRNYNTKPRELSHSQKRLTLLLADLYSQSEAPCREIIRLLLSTVGRGGEGGKGQRIRDDILKIMHRHRIKEVTGHFMEEWHQKLHNNATPDDIVICEAYLAFLRSNGNLGTFYHTLENGGVTRDRLRNFERPIITDPDFAHHLKDGLIHDFENYLRLLKSVHSATDLFSAIDSASHCLDENTRNWAWSIYNDRDNDNIEVKDQVRNLTNLRRTLNEQLHIIQDPRSIRDIIYLDLALEEFVRMVVERRIHLEFRQEHLVELIGLLQENVSFTHNSSELQNCSHQWQKISETTRYDKDWALRARATLDQLTRVMAHFIDYYFSLLQPKADHLGYAFEAEGWSIELFNQEVVRGSSAFVLSALLGHIDPILRETADLGDWQIISHSEAVGRLEIAALSSLQDKKFKTPTIILSEEIKGEEEIPEGVAAVITSSAVDILSHVSVRARNAGILFATCYEPQVTEKLKKFNKKNIKITATASGEVSFANEAKKATIHKPKRKKTEDSPDISHQPLLFSSYALAGEEFTTNLVGGKSLHLKHLKGKLPQWIQTPASSAVPFCVCEKVLELKRNQKTRQQHKSLLKDLNKTPHVILPQLRKNIMTMEAPPELQEAIQKAMQQSGLYWPQSWDTLWERIKHVWASKWNDRAYWSRNKMGMSHDQMYMAVLIQEVIDAEYAFVLHTANPYSRDQKEIYGEIVLGMGEAICSGNYPGRALSFTCRKEKTLKPVIHSYPGKSLALKGRGLIIRSDSSGEDLEGYAGAGLYDSVLLEPPCEIQPDYVNSPLLWDTSFRNKFLRNIAKIAMETENAFDGMPQDIEGAYTEGKFYVVQTRPQV